MLEEKFIKSVLDNISKYEKEQGWKVENKKTISQEETKKLLTKKVSSECIEKEININTSDIVTIVENYIKTVEENSNKVLTKNDKRKFVDECEEELFRIISSYDTKIPLRVLRPEDSKELTLLVIKDFEKSIVQPIIVGSDKATRAEYLKSNKVFSDFMYSILEEMEEKGYQSDIEQVAQQILFYTLSSVHSKKFIIENFETFSFDRNVWKTSYIDNSLINSAGDNISAWENIKKAIDDEEGWVLFCAWVYGVFEPICIKKNRQALWLFGQGLDGKSSVSKVIQYIISGEFGKIYGTTSMGADQMDAKFWGSNIYGKSLTILSEVTDPNIISSKSIGGKFHTWFGGDPAPIEDKGKGAFAAVLSSRCMLHANISPVFDGHINQITRLIPIEFKKTYFKGLEYNGKSFQSSEFEKQLFDQRYAFLKFAKKCFVEKYNDQHLFSITKEYQENYFNISEKAFDINLISQTLEKGEDVYKPQDVKNYLIFVAKNYFRKDLYDRDLGTIYGKVGLKKTTSKEFGSCKIVKCKLNEQYLEAYNEDVNKSYNGNELKKIFKLNPLEDEIIFKSNKKNLDETIKNLAPDQPKKEEPKKNRFDWTSEDTTTNKGE